MDVKEKRIKAITKLYYSNPRVQDAMLKFAAEREVIPRYFEGFGKRPDTIQYKLDIMGLVNKGATSFHASEELWHDPLKINSDMSMDDTNELRKGWDLLIDIDSPYLDYSKIATRLLLGALEEYGIKSYGVKFSGSKGMHIIVPSEVFPKEIDGVETKNMFPDWARAVCEFLMNRIRQRYNREISKLDINFEALEKRTKLSREDVTEAVCPECGRPCKKGTIVAFVCDSCGSTSKRPNAKITKRKLRCINDFCAGVLVPQDEEEHYSCEYCKLSNINKAEVSGKYKATFTKEAKAESGEFEEGISGDKLASLDLVLVAPRHLFRMPYSLHEKTALASVVLEKNEIESFSPREADPLKVKVKDFYSKCEGGEGEWLLKSAIEWKKESGVQEERVGKVKYTGKSVKERVDLKNLSEKIFPKPIKKLLEGLEEGRKRGLFVLLTFLRSLGYDAEHINKRVREWNKLNKPPLKEGYIRSQIDWHLKQKREIMPPNYANDSFYRDLKLIDGKQKAKNPIAELVKSVREGRE